MDGKENTYFVGNVQDMAKSRGWFFGAFMEEPLMQSPLVEVAWQHLPNLEPKPDQKHFHQQSVEVNIVISGHLQITINGTQYNLGPGQFYVVWPLTIVEDLSTDEDAQLIVIRAPSLPTDKYLVS